MSGARKRGLLRLVVLVGVVAWLLVLAARGWFSSDTHTQSTTGAKASAARVPPRLAAASTAMRLPQPLHGATAVAMKDGLLLIGGADRSDVSTDQVLRLDPQAGSVSRAGMLVGPLHDAAAASVGNRTLVFGGGASTTLDVV